MEPVMQQFIEAGRQASYHYADDSGNEWKLGHKHKEEALRLFDDNPLLQADMRRVARQEFLWSLRMERPE